MRDLWDSCRPSGQVFDPDSLEEHPDAARRYLEHAIEPEAPLACAVRLAMSGEIKLGKWRPFQAEQVIAWNRGFVWRASVRMGPARIRGSDSLVDGRAQMLWKLFGLVPVVKSSGPDIDKSAVGRLAAECVWLPSALLLHGDEWARRGTERFGVTLPAAERRIDLTVALASSGALRSVALQRWGELDDEDGFGYRPFGGIAEEEQTWEGYTIPSRLRVGWGFDGERFAPDGEFFRCRIEGAEFK
jgi:hypothetical protein